MKRTAPLPDDPVRNQGPYKGSDSCLEGIPLQAAFLCLKRAARPAEQGVGARGEVRRWPVDLPLWTDGADLARQRLRQQGRRDRWPCR